MMGLFDDPDRVKVQWRLIWLNLSAAAFNFWLVFWLWNFMSIANVISGAFSCWVAWKFWKKIPEIREEQQERIIDYLRG